MNLCSICEFLATEQPVDPCDLILVLAGTIDRKSYGLDLFQKQLAPRMILSVARYEVTPTAALLAAGTDLLILRDKTPPRKRHFWIDMNGAQTDIVPAEMSHSGTFAELQAFAKLIRPQPSSRIALISTSIHLRRVRYCCSRIPGLANGSILLWAVPEPRSSFHCAQWWKRRSDFAYVSSEYAKLLGYKLVY